MAVCYDHMGIDHLVLMIFTCLNEPNVSNRENNVIDTYEQKRIRKIQKTTLSLCKVSSLEMEFSFFFNS